jgi:hypothetical protein
MSPKDNENPYLAINLELLRITAGILIILDFKLIIELGIIVERIAK